MRVDEFKMWMLSLGTMSPRPIGDAISRCKRISDCFDINLDDEFKKDGGKGLISMLEYSTEDSINNKSAPPELNFAKYADIKKGMASLKAAAKKYFEFCQATR